MNLNELRDAVQTVDREVEFRPVGKPTGMFFSLRHESSPQVQEVMRQFQAKVIGAGRVCPLISLIPLCLPASSSIET